MIRVRVYIDVFIHDITFSDSLTTTRNLTFEYITWTLYVVFTGSFLDIVLGQYFRLGMKKTATKNAE